MNPIGYGLKSHPALINWLAGGRRGVSSDTMVQHLTGLQTLRGWTPSHPYDPGDLNRCLLLLQEVPLMRVILPEMANVSPSWAALIENWELVESTFLEEAGPNWSKAKSAPKTYALMRSILDKVRAAAAMAG
jgi:hypothetical protein